MTVAGRRRKRRRSRRRWKGTLYTHYDPAVLNCIHIGSLLCTFVTKITSLSKYTPRTYDTGRFNSLRSIKKKIIIIFMTLRAQQLYARYVKLGLLNGFVLLQRSLVYIMDFLIEIRRILYTIVYIVVYFLRKNRNRWPLLSSIIDATYPACCLVLPLVTRHPLLLLTNEMN